MIFIKVSKKYLILLAGIVWAIAGGFILKIGIPTFLQITKDISTVNVLAYGLASMVIFYLFFFKIFGKLVLKHTKRIKNSTEEKMNVIHFFDLKSYLIMIFMMTIGILGRKLSIFSTTFIGIFYTGLGVALFLAGIKFIYKFISFDKIN